MALALFNAAACGLISLALVGAVLHPRVHDGVVIKAGLISMALGFGSIAVRMFDGLGADEAVHLARSILLINAGLAVVIVGYLWRRARAGQPQRRITDWADLDTRPMEQPWSTNA
jgi:hypothetical protein